MQFNKLIKALLGESKPLYAPKDIDNLINDIIKWVEANCDEQAWAVGQVKFLNDQDQHKIWLLSDYIKKYHYGLAQTPLRVILTSNFNKPVYGSGGYSAKNGYCIIGLNKKLIKTLEMLKIVIRHEMQHVLDPSIVPQTIRANYHQKQRADDVVTLYFDNTLKQTKPTTLLPTHFKVSIANILKVIEEKCDSQEWGRGNALIRNVAYDKEAMKASCASQPVPVATYYEDSQQVKLTLLQHLNTQSTNTHKANLTDWDMIRVSVHSSHPKWGQNTGQVTVSAKGVSILLYIPVEGVFDNTINRSVTSIETDLIHAFAFLNTPKTYRKIKRILQPKQTISPTADNLKQKDLMTPEGYLDYLTAPHPFSGKIPAEYLPRLDTLLTIIPPERWKLFLKAVGKDTQNFNLEQNVQQYLLNNENYRGSDGDIILLQHCLRNPYLRRKTLEKISWHINNYLQ